MGAGEAIVTSGSGCVAVLGSGSGRAGFRASVEPLEPVARIGSGDAFVAGFAAARFAGRSPEACLAQGVACGAESTQHFGAGFVDPGEVERIAGRVSVEPFEALAHAA
jgi:1-phosphofructokinase/tagatose 6-phosphate kinase